MPRPDLAALEQDLLRFGMAARQVRRTLGELDAHFDDLVEDALTTGLDRELAEWQALERLGAMQDIATAARTRLELRDWAHRFPYVALVVYPLGCLAALPAAPVIAYAGDLARWTACILLGGFVTAAMLLLLQLTITLG